MPTASDALEWAARGFRVFPCNVGSKLPAISNFPVEATTDEQRIRQWWVRDYNIGLAMGHGKVAIDIDTKRDTVTDKAVDVFDLFGGDWNTLVTRTATGGYHVIYDVGTERSYASAANLLPGIDVRGEGGYVVAPPSFVIEVDKGVGGGYELERDGPVAPCPDALKTLLKPYIPRDQRQASSGEDAHAAIPVYTDYLQRLATPAIEGQGGDAQTYDVACMGVRDYGLTAATTYQLMLEHYNPRCVPPWEPDDLWRKVENADMYAVGALGSRDPTPMLSNMAFTAPSVQPMRPPQAVKPVSGRLLDPTDIPIVEWLVPGLLRRGEVTMVSGPSGAGKSSWMLGLLVFGAAGRQYGPFVMPKRFSSWMYNAEDSPGDMTGRAVATCMLHQLDYRKDIQPRLMVLDRDHEIILAEKVGSDIQVPAATIEYLNSVFAEQPDTDVLCFDPMISCLRNVEENDNNEMAVVMKVATKLARAYNVAIIIGHHIPKGLLQNKLFDPSSVDVARGAGAIGNLARIAYNLFPQLARDEEIQGKRVDVFSLWNAKASHGERAKPSWWQRKIMTVPNGVDYPAPLNVLARDIASAHWRAWIDAMGDYMTDNGLNEFRVADAGIFLSGLDPDEERSSKTITNALRDYVFKRGDATHRYVDHHGASYTMALHTQDDNGRAISRGQFFTLVPLMSSMPLPPVVLPPPPPDPNDLSSLY